MSARLTRRMKALATGAGALALGVLIALGATAPANAAPEVDPAATGSINVHKLAQPDSATGLPHNGTQVDTTGLTPLEGVTFSVQRVTDIDLTDPADWQILEGLDAATVAAQHTLGAPQSQVTDERGDAVFAGLPIGVYLVSETDPGQNGITIAGEPFLVSVPTPLEGDWIYDVHVYPKNTVTTAPVKTVDDADAFVIGDAVAWTITAKVPAVVDGQRLTHFALTDSLDSRLDYVGASVSVEGVTLDAADYTITPGPAFAVSFTASGLAKLENAAGATITVVIDTTVNAIGDGAIENSATVFVNDPDHSNGLESVPVTTSWGSLRVLKHGGDDTDLTLAGAEFDVHNAAGEVVAHIVTGEDGIAVIDLKAGDYTLVETAAPLGYVLDPTPIPVTVVEGATASTQVTVSNEQVPAFQLPLTGGDGTALFIAAGVAIALLGAGIGLTRRRTAA
ncbi:SpaH/EbpB family LPXTG-anchored major pilin [Microbacterium sediminis]|nr:SpaH/EbpB family LPXTG-anchored major pilin [Microbacterium sediminis]